MMVKRLSCGLILAALAVLQACGQPTDRSGDGQTVATINDYHLSLQAFERQLASEMELEADYKLTQDARRAFLDSLIDKELLIQEAVRLKLDREEAFTKAIEKYWESTLIRDLISMKSLEISESITITQEEIADRYQTLQRATPSIGPLTEGLQDQLREELKASKKTMRLNAWIQEMRSQATIEINEALLAGQ